MRFFLLLIILSLSSLIQANNREQKKKPRVPARNLAKFSRRPLEIKILAFRIFECQNNLQKELKKLQQERDLLESQIKKLSEEESLELNIYLGNLINSRETKRFFLL